MILIDRYWVSSKSNPDDEVLLVELVHGDDTHVFPPIAEYLRNPDNVIRFEQIMAPYRTFPFEVWGHG